MHCSAHAPQSVWVTHDTPSGRIHSSHCPPREEPDVHVPLPFFINCMQVGSRRGGRYQRHFGAFICLFLYISFLLVVCLAQRCTPPTVRTVQYAHCTGLFEMNVGVLTTCHTQYTSDSSICIFYLVEQHSKFL